jgi:thiamine pyrophosphokinase
VGASSIDRAIVVASGARVPDHARPSLRADAYVVAADGGVDAALAMGLTVDLAIGDLDSVTGEGLAHAEAAGARVERHPVAKDATDLELALDAAVEVGARDIVVLASGGGRLDHLLAAALVMAAPSRQGVRLAGWFGSTYVAVVTPSMPAHLTAPPGSILTLLPVHGTARGVRTDGLEYPLHDEELAAGTSRGVSNVFVGSSADISISAGTVLAVVPADPDEGPT